MAEWKTQVTYSYNPSYQTYYGVLYQPMAGQNHLPAWSDSGLTDLSSYNGGATQSVTTDINTTMTGEESPPRSPESRNCYPGTELSYLHDSHEGQLTLAVPPPEIYGGAGEVRRARSDSISDSEAHTSPGKCFTTFILIHTHISLNIREKFFLKGRKVGIHGSLNMAALGA